MSVQAEKVKCIGELEICERRSGLPENHANRVEASPPDNQRACYVVGSGLTIFTEDITGQVKRDILNATLLAQLVANTKHDCEQNVLDWNSEYRRVLQSLGFVIESFEFNAYVSSGPSLSIDQAVLEIIGSMAASNDLAVLQAALDTMRQLPIDDERIVLFDTQCSHNSCGNFQIYICSQGPDGEVNLTLGTFYFKGTEMGTNFIFHNQSSSSTQLYKSVVKTVLNTEVYATVRSAVINKLGRFAESLVTNVELWVSNIALALADMCEY